MDWILLFIVLGWPAIGIAAHLDYCFSHKTWCGTPIWEEPSTYIMFFPAAVAGPLMLFTARHDGDNG